MKLLNGAAVEENISGGATQRVQSEAVNNSIVGHRNSQPGEFKKPVLKSNLAANTTIHSG